MAQLRVSEKEHWVARIQKRIDERKADLLLEHPGLLEQFRNEATDKAKKQLGLTAFFARLEEIEAEKNKLEQEKEKIHGQMEKAIERHGMTDEVLYGSGRGRCYYRRDNVERAVELRRDQLLRRIQEAHPIGALLAKLDAEKEAAVDAVWLATGPAVLAELWETVEQVADVEPTKLVKSAKKAQKKATVSAS